MEEGASSKPGVEDRRLAWDLAVGSSFALGQTFVSESPAPGASWLLVSPFFQPVVLGIGVIGL